MNKSDETISRQGAVEGVKELFACADVGNDECDIIYMLENLPSADRPTGKWLEVYQWDGDCHYMCDQCKEEIIFFDGTPKENNYNYCPNCGAKMKGGTE